MVQRCCDVEAERRPDIHEVIGQQQMRGTLCMRHAVQVGRLVSPLLMEQLDAVGKDRGRLQAEVEHQRHQREHHEREAVKNKEVHTHLTFTMQPPLHLPAPCLLWGVPLQ